MYKDIIQFIQNLYGTKDMIPLHAPFFMGNEKKFLDECMDSTYVSGVGKFVDRFEAMMEDYTGCKKAVACVNGTNALHLSLLLSGVERNDEVITQPLTFIATCNAIIYAGAHPVFIDVDKDTMGLSPVAVDEWLSQNTYIENLTCYNKKTGRRVKVCLPMHTFGHPVHLDGLMAVCDKYYLELVEDAAESLGSFYKGKHTGTFGKIGIISFNGNKTITTGGGGMMLFNDEKLAKRAKHLTTQAKLPHRWDFIHDEIGYNYRLPNINAALGCAQMEYLDKILAQKREIAMAYKKYFQAKKDIVYVDEPDNCQSNFWLNTILFSGREGRDLFLKYSNDHHVMTRPAWTLMNRLPMFALAQCGSLDNAISIEGRIVNLPSSANRYNET
ncbi:MAG: LegC family aminotransferase [Tannerella sp.]|jgi:aminotransferase in exopolysaccharide biosynthesis|nr:LegC family aminotransferase [Tannerella sp.]